MPGPRSRRVGAYLVLAAAITLAGCGVDAEVALDDAGSADASAPDAAPDVASARDASRDTPGVTVRDAAPDVATVRDAAPDVVTVRDAAPDVAADVPAPPPIPTAANLLALTQSCVPLAGAPRYATDSGEVANIPICTLRGAVFWHSDLDVDCDGGRTRVCRADPSYLPDTSATTSTGAALDAETVPFIVVPLARNGLDYRRAGFQLGSVAVVLYRGRMAYAVFGDEGPSGIIGEGSYSLASALGINPDPSIGGVDTGVTFVLFTGGASVVMRNEDHAEAVRLGTERATQLLLSN